MALPKPELARSCARRTVPLTSCRFGPSRAGYVVGENTAAVSPPAPPHHIYRPCPGSPIRTGIRRESSGLLPQTAAFQGPDSSLPESRPPLPVAQCRHGFDRWAKTRRQCVDRTVVICPAAAVRPIKDTIRGLGQRLLTSALSSFGERVQDCQNTRGCDFDERAAAIRGTRRRAQVTAVPNAFGVPPSAQLANKQWSAYRPA
jgi:hypothetical protein